MQKYSIFVGLAIIFTFFSCEEKEKGEVEIKKERFFCDAETSIALTYGQGFKGENGVVFNGGEGRCENCGINGSAGVKLDSVNLYGMNLMLFDLKPGEYFEVSAFEKKANNKGAIIVKFTGGAAFSLSSDVHMVGEENGWTKHSLTFNVLTAIDTANFFLHAGGSEAIFDDFEIVRYSEQPMRNINLSEGLNLYFPDSAKAILYDNLDACVKLEIIPNKRKKYVDAGIKTEVDTQNIEIRLKGDWTDHIKSGSPSFRIKTNDEYAFKGLRSFSIQHPKTRNYMHEWFFHQLLDREDILTTRYEFLPVSINGKFKSIYALEEHFDKQLLESRNRREGPILKMDESGFWALLYKGASDFEGSYPYYESSIVDVFKSNRTRKNPTLFGQFLNGAVLLNMFKNLSDRPDIIFDLDREAKFFALMELGNIVHGLAWHNRRFYLNPVNQKLEHIGYDLQPGYMPMNPTRLENEMDVDQTVKYLPNEKLINRELFKNDEFRANYLRYLSIYSSKKYLDSIFQVMDDEIKENEDLLRIDLPNYYFDRTFYYKRAEVLHSQLQSLQQVSSEWAKSPQQILPLSNTSYVDPDFPFYIEEISLNSYANKIDSSNYELTIENFHLGEVEVIGYETKDSLTRRFLLKDPLRFSSFSEEGPSKRTIKLMEKPKRILFKLKEFGDSIFSKKPIKWPAPGQSHPRKELLTAFNLNNPLFQLKGDTLYVSSADYVVDELIYIPKKYALKIEAGTVIDFVNGGGLIINNNAYFLGEEDDRILISSSDRSSNGVTILNADEVLMNHVRFGNLNTLNKDGWLLTGGLTVYESTVKMNHVSIIDAQSEDALNLIRCEFDIDNLLIDGTFSDGFDSDYCSGSIENAEFRNTGNDCIDFSGSLVTMQYIVIKNSGDKGVSAGEASNIYVENIKINDAETGFASKDDSDLNVVDGDLKNVKVGISAFQKKPEFGPSRIYLVNVVYENVTELALVEYKSSCIYRGKVYLGYQKFDIEKMYEKFNK